MEIKLEQVEYIYDKTKTKVLQDINVTFSTGKIIGIIGPMSSGKTTLLELIAGKRFPSKGKISLGEYAITKQGISSDSENFYSNVGFLSQFPENKFLHDSIRKELDVAMERHNCHNSSRERHMEKALTIVGLGSSYLTRDPFSLSNGEMRRVSLACALSYNPKIIVLDEPFIGLDSADRKNLVTILTMIKSRYQKTIVIASNDVDFLNKIADEIVILKNGKVLLFGNKQEVFKNIEILEKEEIPLPNITEFENYVLKSKKVHLGHRSEVNDLVKDILRSLQ